MSENKRHKGNGAAQPDAAADDAADLPEEQADGESDAAGDDQPHENDSNRDDNIDAADNPAAARNTHARLEKLERTQLHFSKIAQQFAFQPNAAAFMDWTVQFEAELSSCNLDHVLTDDPEAAEQRWSEDSPELQVARQEQKTVYNMIVRCITNPQTRTVVVTAQPLLERTGFHTWRTLRRHFIGNEQAYLLLMESQFEAFRWEAAESWATMETRFDGLLAQLAVAGVHKEPHQKIARIMSAIQQAGRHDAQNGSVYTRLHTTNRIKDDLGYPDWMTAMRTEAQMIQDELAKRGAKRPRDERDAEEHRQSVSFVGQTMHDGPAAAAAASTPFTPRFGEQQPVCRIMRDRGVCPYGKSCRFSHNVPAGGRSSNFSNNFSNRSQGGNSSNRGQGGMNGGRNSSYNGQGGQSQGGNRNGGASKSNICFEYVATGHCSRGGGCRFSHAAGAGAKQEGSGGSYKQEVQFAQVFSVQSEHAVLKESQDGVSAPHRVLADSCASVDLTPRRDFISNLRPLAFPISIRGAFGKTATATLYGEGRIPVGHGAALIVPEMVYCELLQDTLLSLVKLYQRGHTLNISRYEGMFIDESATFAIPISFRGSVFTLMFDTTEDQQRPAIHSTAEAHAATRAMTIRETPAEEKAAPAEPAADNAAAATTAIPASSIHAHAIYGHLCGRKLDQLIEHQAAEGLSIQQKHPSHKLLIANCAACMMAKMKRVSFGKEMKHLAAAPNDLVVADSIGPITVHKTKEDGTVETAKFYISMVTDVYSRHLAAQVLPDKHPSDHVISYSHWAKIQTSRDLKHFHTDGGKEYNRAETVLESRGTEVTRTPIHTPQWNAIAERKNRTIVEMARAFLLHADLDPDVFWMYAFETAVFTHNRVTVVHPHNKTPHELFTGHKPDVSLLRTFGAPAWVRIANTDLHPAKMDARGEQGIFVGYDIKRELCYRIWVNGRVIVSRDVRFDEQQLLTRKAARSDNNGGGAEIQAKIDRCLPASLPDSNLQPHPDGADEEPAAPESMPEDESMAMVDARTMKKIAAAENGRKATPRAPPTRESTRTKKQTKQTGMNPNDFGVFAVSSSLRNANIPAPAPPRVRVSEIRIPRNRREAERSPYAEYFLAAMDKEMASIAEHETFELVKRPENGVNIVSCKWVFAVKADKNGFVDRFKARLVARGFSQQHGVDYTETYSSVVRFKAIRVLYAVCAIRGYTLELMDVNGAYLNAPLKERVYMAQPDGYVKGGVFMVWLLKKALYGLKQSGREWGEHITAFILSLGFARCKSDPCVYIRVSASGRPILIAVYVDDIPGAFDEADRAEWEGIKRSFAEKYSIKFFGEADWLLNMRITRDRSSKLLWIDQQSYIEDMLEELGLEEGHGVDNPGAQSEMSKADSPSTPEEQAHMRTVPYRRFVGLLSWLAQTYRPDIAHAVNQAAQNSQNPGATHWRAVLQILRYLRKTADFALLFDGRMDSAASTSPAAGPASPMVVFADANWGGCKDTRRSTTGWLIRLGRCPIDWRSQKQPTVALSSCEAEYMAVCDATQSAMWIHQLLVEIGFIAWMCPNASTPPVPLVLSDNKSAIALAHNDGSHGFSKHIAIKHHFIRDQVEAKFVSLQWISTHDQVADIFTKVLPTRIFAKFRDQLVTPMHSARTEQQEQPDAPAAAGAGTAHRTNQA
jgi:Reverse transcriptase (RNA-dependent DNA polymerase)